MQPKPEQFSSSYAEAFKEQQVVEDYRYRPPYPDEVFDILTQLITDEPRTLLDVGTGPGDIARHMVEVVEQVDAVDFSQAMIEQGKRLLNGDHPRLHWIYGKVEEVPLTPPYALITAGSSIHWLDWEVAFPRFRSMLTPNGLLALIYRRTLPMPWDSELRKLRAQFSTRRNRWPSSAGAELEARGFFHRRGEKETAPIPYSQTIDEYIAGLHSRSGLSRERMGEQRAEEFDQQVRALLLQHHQDQVLPLQANALVIWGTPEVG
jgi:ubiquinone/menaquinone biosynthesis C-methylase UbiE